MTTTVRSHIGRAGDHAVMAEFLLRGWNVAIPEVDVGDDIFVVDDNADRVIRVQVKTAERGRTSGDGVRAIYAGISLAQIWGRNAAVLLRVRASPRRALGVHCGEPRAAARPPREG